MDELNKTEGIHLAGEAEFTFPTAGGRVRLSVTEDALTPYGGLVPWGYGEPPEGQSLLIDQNGSGREDGVRRWQGK